MDYKTCSKIFALSILLGMCVLPGRADAVKEFYSVAKHTRALGMGGAFYGLSDDEYAIFYNPAGLSRYAARTQLMLQTRLDIASGVGSAIEVSSGSGANKTVASVISDLDKLRGTPIYAGIGVSVPFYAQKNFALSLQLADAKGSFAILGRDLDTTLDVSIISDSGVVAGYGDTFFTPGLHLGANAKGLLRAGGKQSFTALEIAQGSKLQTDVDKLGGVGAGIDLDLGAMYELPKLIPRSKLTTSLVISNLFASNMNMIHIAGGKPPGLPRMLTLAAAAEVEGVGVVDKFNVVLDLAEFQIGGESDLHFGARGGSFWKHVNLGVEVPLVNQFYVRTGLHQGYLTGGVGLDARFFKLDLATYAEELAELPGRLPSRRVAMRIALGYGGRLPTVPSATSSESVGRGFEKTSDRSTGDEL